MTGTHVSRILVADDEVKGVRLGTGEEVESPLVISTADPKRTLLELIDPVWLDPELLLAARNIKMRGCTAFVLYAVDRALDDPTKSFTASVSLTPSTAALERAADAAKYGQIAAEPHVEIFSPTLRWPQLAPEFKHVVTARVHFAPYALREGKWDAKRCDALEKKVTAMIARVAPAFESTVIHRAVLSPRDVEERFGVTEGALTHGELMLDQMLFMRPVAGWGRYYLPIRGLYLGGAGAHPGPGVLGGAGFLAAKATGG
jgi:phytoene dehydrogenase-like protein